MIGSTIAFKRIAVFTKFEFAGEEYVKVPIYAKRNAIDITRGMSHQFGPDALVIVCKTTALSLDKLVGTRVTLILEDFGNWEVHGVVYKHGEEYSVGFGTSASVRFTEHAVTEFLDVDGVPTIRIGGLEGE